MLDEFMTVDMLTTFVGITTAVTVIVQFTKSMIKRRFNDHAVRLYAFIVAIILTFVFAGNFSGIRGIILTLINAMLITATSMGGYEILSDPLAQKRR